MPINHINNGDSGFSARTTLNEVIDYVNAVSGSSSAAFHTSVQLK